MSSVPLKDRLLSEYQQALLTRALRAIATAQAADQPVTARRIGLLLDMSETSGLEIRAALVKHGFLEVLRPPGGGRSSAIRITGDGWALIGDAPAAEAGQGTERRCMGCGNPFTSEGAHHRFCDACRGSDDFRQGAAEYRVLA